VQIARLTREKAKLEQELATSRFVVEVQAELGALWRSSLRERGQRAGADAVTGEAIIALVPRIGARAACAAAGVPRASWDRRHRVSPSPARRPPVPHRSRAALGRPSASRSRVSWTATSGAPRG
jgi:hypothetical protein